MLVKFTSLLSRRSFSIGSGAEVGLSSGTALDVLRRRPLDALGLDTKALGNIILRKVVEATLGLKRIQARGK
jgi:hypothetical protein